MLGSQTTEEKFVFYLILNHRRPLSTQHLDRLEHIDDAFVTHSLQYDTQSDEDASPTDPGAAQQTDIISLITYEIDSLLQKQPVTKTMKFDPR